MSDIQPPSGDDGKSHEQSHGQDQPDTGNVVDIQAIIEERNSRRSPGTAEEGKPDDSDEGSHHGVPVEYYLNPTEIALIEARDKMKAVLRGEDVAEGEVAPLLGFFGALMLASSSRQELPSADEDPGNTESDS